MTYQLSVIRWAFNVLTWKPIREHISASSYIQSEEKERISRIIFQNDAISSLIERFMLTKYLHLITGMPYEEICCGRDEKEEATFTQR